MKNIALICLLSMMSFTASAATLNIDAFDTVYEAQTVVTSSQPSLPTSFETSFGINTLTNSFNEFNVFETHPNGDNSEITFSQYSLLDSSDNIVSSAALAGVSAFSFAYHALADTAYTLELFGTLGSSPTRVHLTGLAQTPIPAALWLFGPLMVGLLGFRKRFMK